jgi:predicted TIM-barrel fold metal-dependent hydrolase
MIIDGHAHYLPPEIAQNTSFYRGAWTDLSGLLRAMDQARVDKVVLLYPTTDAHRRLGGHRQVCSEYNRRLAAIVREHPDRLIGAGAVPHGIEADVRGVMAELAELPLSLLSLASSQDGVYLDHPAFQAVFQLAAERGLPVHVHAQTENPIGFERVKDPLLMPVFEFLSDVTMAIGKMLVAGTFHEHRAVKFIFAHYGGMLPLVMDRLENTYGMLLGRQMVRELPEPPRETLGRLYFDTSGSSSRAALATALEVVPASHVIWGSDFPSNQALSAGIDRIRAWELQSSIEAGLLGGNMTALLEEST